MKAFYRPKWHLAKWFNFSRPVHIDIELTTQCNMNCPICYKQSSKIEKGDMNKFLQGKILAELSDLGAYSVKLNWRGDGLINSKVIMKALRCTGLWVMVNTRLNMKIEDDLYIDELKVSLDTVDGLNAQIIRNINKLRKRQVVKIQRKIYDGIESLEQFKFGLIEKLGDRENIEIRESRAIQRNDSDIFQGEKRERQYCAQPSRRLVIGWNGKVFACCCAYEEPDELYLGDVTKQTLKEIWQGKKRKELVEKLKKGIYEGVCKNCVSRDSYK